MLVDCPKCGFIQPKDRYCASCGVDMDAFHPKEISLVNRILGNPIFLILIVTGLVFMAIIFIRKQRVDELRNRAQYLQSGPVVVDRRNLSVEPVVSTDSATVSRIASATATNPVSNPTTTNMSPTTASPGASANAPTSPAESGIKNVRVQIDRSADGGSAKRSQVKMIVYLTELPRGEIKKMEEWARQGGQWQHFDEVYWGVVPGMGRHMKELTGITFFERTEKTIDLQANSTQWFNGSRHKGGDLELDMGLNFYMAIEEVSDHHLKVSIEAQRALREGSLPQIVRKSFSFNFEIKGDAGFVASGILPRKLDIESMEDEYPWDNFLKIFKSNSYLANQTDFALLFEFDLSK